MNSLRPLLLSCLLLVALAQDAAAPAPVETVAAAPVVAAPAVAAVPAFSDAEILKALGTTNKVLEQNFALLNEQNEKIQKAFQESTAQLSSSLLESQSKLTSLPSSISSLSQEIASIKSQASSESASSLQSLAQLTEQLNAQRALLDELKRLTKTEDTTKAAAPAAALEQLSKQLETVSSTNTRADEQEMSQLRTLDERLSRMEKTLGEISSASHAAKLVAIEKSLSELLSRFETEKSESFQARFAGWWADVKTGLPQLTAAAWEKTKHYAAVAREEGMVCVSRWSAEGMEHGKKLWAAAVVKSKECSILAVDYSFLLREKLQREVATRFDQWGWKTDYAYLVATGLVALGGALAIVVGLILFRFVFRVIAFVFSACCCRKTSAVSDKKKKKRRSKKPKAADGKDAKPEESGSADEGSEEEDQ